MQISEYVSLGHPDKMADYISSYILDRYIKKDPNTRYAVECQIKGSDVNLAGEITSKAKFTKKQIEKFVKEAVAEIGYTKEYQKFWGKQNTICDKDIKVHTFITKQSPDIAQGLEGWGDQGIFFGCAYPDLFNNCFELTHCIAKSIGQRFFNEGVFGKDIKVLVVADNGHIDKVVLALPVKEGMKRSKELNTLFNACCDSKIELIINGTGKFVKHGPIADSGTTGRKLAVDFYGGSCKIGGGSPWTKDGSKADLTLNLYARYLALKYLKDIDNSEPVFCDIACSIGKKEIDICIHNGAGKIFERYKEQKSPKELIKFFKLNTPIYAELCKNGLFSRIK